MPLDIGVGILLSLGVAEMFGVHASPLFIAFGVAAALLPDIDIVTIPLLGKWHHRTITHFPLFYLPLAALAWVALPHPYAALLILGIYLHLIHDTFGIGWGIAWLWPFSPRKLLLFPAKDRPEFSGSVATWLPREEAALKSTGHRGDWIRHYYFSLNSLAYIEYGTLAVAIAVMALYLGNN